MISELRHRAVRFAAEAGADHQLVANVALAVSEAVTNVVKHAYPAPERGQVELTASVREDWLEISVTDHGGGMRIHSGGGMGMGLPIIAKVCDAHHLIEGDRGIELQMRFRLSEFALRLPNCKGPAPRSETCDCGSPGGSVR